NKIVIGALNLVPTPMTRCEPFNGAVTATPTVGSAADYKYTWYNGKTIKALSDYPNDTTNILAGLPEGFYTVKAVNRTTYCETPAKFAEVQNLTPSINITVVPNPAKYPTDCNAKNGEISAIITIAGNVGGFTVDWYKSNSAAPIGLDSLKKHQVLTGSPAVDLLSNVSTGFYSINVTNADDNCKDSKVYFLPSLSSDSLTVSATDASDCNPVNGQFTAELLIKAGNPFTKDDYIVELYKLGTNVPVYSIIGTSNPGNTFNFPPAGQPLDTGKYYVVAIGNPARPFGNSICTIAGGTQEINFSVIEPTLALDSIANTHCAAAVAPDGQIIANLATGPLPHNFEFFTGANNLDVADRVQNSASNTLTGRLGGFYTVQLTADNGCTAVSSIFVPTDTASVTADITALPRTLCDTENGSIQINGVQEITSTGSVVAPFTTAAYTVTWYDSTATGILSDPVAATANILENLKQNEYFVEIINDVTGCKTSKILMEVEDGREYPAFDLISFMNPTSCLKGETGAEIDPATGQRLGHLEINVTSTSAGGFTFNWYTGDPKTLPPLGNHTALLSGLTTAETYTVEVINNTNNCPKEEVYTVPLERIPLTLSASAAPLTNCINPDGRLNAIVTSAGNGFDDYTYNWYIGTAVTPPATFTGRFIDQAFFETYLIVATDQLDPGCEVRDTVVVEDGRIFPVVNAGVLNPLTICDVTKPDGTAFAAVGNNVIDYTFAWFDETITPPPFASGSQISNLSDGTYTVIATNIVSLCSDTTQVQINFMPLPVPMPTIDILSHLTNCDPDLPNGALAVSVGGNTTDYIFNWYDGLERKTSPDFEGVIYDSLVVNDYSVIAIDRVTLCESPLVSRRIEFQPVYPKFVIDVEPTLCGLTTGAIFLTITNDVEVTGMEWFVGESMSAAENSTTVIETGPVVLDADNGYYRVDIFTPTGCDTTGYVEIKNEINPYNGISRNGDDRNSYFHINCIEDFPSNVVKIFNRNGTLVFEGHGYDNTATLFDGVSNKGISPMGNNLPDGTYFYVIDKKDGSKPIAGYLEIVN
ncbi:MAG TPA: gliding motility-associated C-terminal domain-containing protein, partial [Ohtaekwangia sp.]|nr:gliding motility-associated C-terminal domain-containing protein [Ohtaekwangia sp.]